MAQMGRRGTELVLTERPGDFYDSAAEAFDAAMPALIRITIGALRRRGMLPQANGNENGNAETAKPPVQAAALSVRQ